jgi:hypothetical protein
MTACALLARSRRALAACGAALRRVAGDPRDAIFLVGLGLLFWGAWEVWQPLAPLVVGGVLAFSTMPRPAA